VVVLASLMAIVLQIIAARLGVTTGKDLAQACRDWYPRWTRLPNWLLAEIAIVACDLAEVLGSAVALNLLFHISLFWAVLITACDVLLLLMLQGLGMRLIEAVVTVLVGTIAGCYCVELFVLPANPPELAAIGYALANPGLARGGMAAVAVGIIGATVMPHNLYLHSALVRSRGYSGDAGSMGDAIRFNTIDSIVALALACLVNAAILILAAMVFNDGTGTGANGPPAASGPDTDWIRVAYLTLSPALGTAAAGLLFAVALLASGVSSTITGTLAGQTVMEGFMHWRLAPWKRRLITRLAALVPAVGFVALSGSGNVNGLLVLSQAVLALQLPFAMLPLLHFASSRRFSGHWKIGGFLLVAGWASAVAITVMDLYGLPDTLRAAGRILGDSTS
jgi:manganese transport protein